MTYVYTHPYVSLDEAKLRGECLAAGLPVTDVQRVGDEAQTVFVITSRDLAPAEQSTLAGLVAAHDGRPRRKRKPYDLYLAITGLTAAQQQNVAADLFGGSPPKYTQDQGGDAPDLLVMWAMTQAASLSSGDKNLIKRVGAAIYCRDNPAYLVSPAFDATINVPGDEPYTP